MNVRECPVSRFAVKKIQVSAGAITERKVTRQKAKQIKK